MNPPISSARAQDGFNVVDGQQRLATSMIILAAIRDIYCDIQEPTLAKPIDNQYFFYFNRKKDRNDAQLILNVQDHQFFLNTYCTITVTPNAESTGL